MMSLDELLNFDALGKEESKMSPRVIITLDSINAKINAVSPEELFWQYVKSGFLYANKKRKLTPYLSLVEENWKKALSLGEEIFWIATVKDDVSLSWASICNWRSTLNGWISQHLVATGQPAYPLMLMLATCWKVVKESEFSGYESFQNWYRPTNKYANKVFGTLASSLPKTSTTLHEYRYFVLERNKINSPAVSNIRVKRMFNSGFEEVTEFVKNNRGSLYAATEELDIEDIELKSLDEIYQRAKLRRNRSFFMAYAPGHSKPLAAAIVYRAPVGLNFSMLENRCDVVIDGKFEEADLINAIDAVISAAGVCYQDFPGTFIPVVAEDNAAKLMTKLGYAYVRTYNQFIWTKSGYYAWYDSMFNVGKSIIERWRNRRGDV